MYTFVNKQTFVGQLGRNGSLVFVKIGVSIYNWLLRLTFFALFPNLGLLLFQVLSDSAFHQFLLVRELSEKECSRGLVDFLPFLNFLSNEKLDSPSCFLCQFSSMSVENLVFYGDT